MKAYTAQDWAYRPMIFNVEKLTWQYMKSIGPFYPGPSEEHRVTNSVTQHAEAKAAGYKHMLRNIELSDVPDPC